ncbi:MAG: pseudouridine synthase [Cyanobacteria bacterium J06638_7]
MPAAPEASSLLFHKPYGVLSQFTPESGSPWRCLADFISVPGVYAAGRLDADSEGLLLLTAHGPLQHQLTDPARGHWRRYWVQVEGDIGADRQALERLSAGVMVQARRTLPARAELLSAGAIEAAAIAERDPPIRRRRAIPTSWLQLELREGRNRQVRRMTAAVGHPTLRLLRVAIDLMDGGPALSLEGLAPGEWRQLTPAERKRLDRLATTAGRGGRAGAGKSGRGGGGR